MMGLWRCIRQWCTGKPLEEPDLEVTVWNWPILRVFRSREKVKKVLCDYADTEFTWPYTAVKEVLHQHDEIHHHHAVLNRAIARVPWLQRMKDSEQQFFCSLLKHRQRLDLAWREYLGLVWFGAFFAETDLTHLQKLHQELSTELKRRFFSCWYWRIPVLGPWIAKKRAVPRDLIQRIHQLPRAHLLHDLDDFRVADDASVLAFLVYDFLYEAGMEVMIQSLSDPNQHSPQWSTVFQHSYFFPWRLRWWQGVLTAVNLQTSGLFWSAGRHLCPGQLASQSIFHSLYLLVRRNPWRMSLMHAPLRKPGERPSSGPLTVYVELSRQLELPHIQEQDRTLFHVNSIFWQPALIDWIKHFMAFRIIRDVAPLEDVVIVSPEARGWLIASLVAQQLKCPLVLARKGGKEKGTVVCQESYRTVYSEEQVLEMSAEAPIYPYSQVVIIDDGVASGGSLSALVKLLKKSKNVTPQLMLAIFRHHEKKEEGPQNGWSKTLIEDVPTWTMFDTYQINVPH